jgi:hypothetical protein
MDDVILVNDPILVLVDDDSLNIDGDEDEGPPSTIIPLVFDNEGVVGRDAGTGSASAQRFRRFGTEGTASPDAEESVADDADALLDDCCCADDDDDGGEANKIDEGAGVITGDAISGVGGINNIVCVCVVGIAGNKDDSPLSVREGIVGGGAEGKAATIAVNISLLPVVAAINNGNNDAGNAGNPGTIGRAAACCNAATACCVTVGVADARGGSSAPHRDFFFSLPKHSCIQQILAWSQVNTPKVRNKPSRPVSATASVAAGTGAIAAATGASADDHRDRFFVAITFMIENKLNSFASSR